MGVTSWYFCLVFKRLNDAERDIILRANRLQTKEMGRSRFIRRQILFCLLFWLPLMPVLDWLTDRGPYSSLRSDIFIDLAVLPIFLLGGYLEGRWKWTDLEKEIGKSA